MASGLCRVHVIQAGTGCMSGEMGTGVNIEPFLSNGTALELQRRIMKPSEYTYIYIYIYLYIYTYTHIYIDSFLYRCSSFYSKQGCSFD